MNLGRLQAGLIFLALVNMSPALEADGAWTYMLIALVSAMGALLLARADGSSRVPTWVVVLGVLGAVAYSASEMLQPQTIYILDLAHFIILLACCKFFELRTHRDMALVVLIGFLLLVIGAFVSASPLFGIVLLIDVTFGIAWLLRFQADREVRAILDRRRAAWAAAKTDQFNRAPEAVALENCRLLRPALSHAVVAVFIASIVFVSVPRGWGKGLFGRIQSAIPLGVTSFTDEIQLRDATIIEDARIVLRTKFSSENVAIGGDDFRPYLRGATFERYRNGRWRRTRPRALSQIDTNRDGLNRLVPGGPGTIRGEQLIDQEVWIDTPMQGTLFALYPPLMMGSKDIRRILIAQSDLSLETEDGVKTGFAYHVTSAIPGPKGFPHSTDAPSSRRDWSDGFSTIHPAIKAFAQERFASQEEPQSTHYHERIATRICSFLRDGEYQYSLSRSTDWYEGDRVKDFLFHNRFGHCEYFASAMTLLCQSLNIPARMVSGFCAGEFVPVGSFYQFRAKDAHAWVEVWLEGRGWVGFDPSPAAVSERAVTPNDFWAGTRRFADYFRFKWATTVVSFDAASRRELFENFESWLRLLIELKHRPSSIGEAVATLLWGPDMLPFWQRVCYWLLLALLALLGFILIRIGWILSLRAREYFSGKSPAPRGLERQPQARFYDRLLLLLENKGHVKSSHQTPREFAEQLAATHSDLRDVPRLTDWFYQAQYGSHGPTPEQLAQIKSMLSRLREEPGFGAR